MKFLAFLILGVLSFVVFSVIAFFLGLLLVGLGFPRYGVHLIAVSGLFPSLIPKYCSSHDCTGNYRCKNWTCPRYNVKRDSSGDIQDQ